MYSLIQQTEAILDAQEAYNWYEDIKPGLGAEFLKEIEAGLNKISFYPHNYSFISKHLRKIRTRRFPYIIIFSIIKEDIIVHGIRHIHQKPKKYRK